LHITQQKTPPKTPPHISLSNFGSGQLNFRANFSNSRKHVQHLGTTNNKNKNFYKNKQLAAGSVTLQKQKPKTKMHEPVLLSEVLEVLSPRYGESYLDMTAGLGGHAQNILAKTQNFKDCVLVDRDQDAINRLQAKFANQEVEIINENFYQASLRLIRTGRQFDLILADLGVSSLHLNTASRGFSFMRPGLLDMRMDQRQKLTAEDVINTYSAIELEEIIKEYGEEPKSRIIAKRIVENRPISNTTDLANIVARAYGKRSSKHPATRTFQAIRIAVNDELRRLSKSLPVWLSLLKPGGRVGIISFHSLEDRIVKKFFKENSINKYDAKLKLLTKSPISASNNELVNNPRSRSAKLRAAEKIKTTERASDEN
jgi:16S rRNA (cytosine1402-N4)-methyltransferase